jgi:endonuclease YncB( thermonuclease family)
MIENGWAVAFRKHTVDQEGRARERRLGLWSDEFQRP